MNKILNLMLQRDKATANEITLAKCCDIMLAEIQSLKAELDSLKTHPPNLLAKLDHQAHATQAARVWAEAMKKSDSKIVHVGKWQKAQEKDAKNPVLSRI